MVPSLAMRKRRSKAQARRCPSILAYHWREAGEPARAIPYLLAAADAARRSWASGAVADLYSRALELAEDDELRRRIAFEKGVALVELGDYPAAADELSKLIPQLEGQQKLDALLARAHATLWTERDVETLEIAEEALPLAEKVGDDTAIPAALAAKSQALAMRGADGDLDDALELGDRALELWVPGTRALSLRHHLHLHANTTCWVGEYERSVGLSQRTRALASDVKSAESLLRGGGLEALALTGLGRHEEAIAIFDELFEIARELGQSPQVVLNYSSLAYRDLYDLDEARARSERGPLALGSAVVRHAETVRRLRPALHANSSPVTSAGRRRTGRTLGPCGKGDGLDDLAGRRTPRCGAGRDRLHAETAGVGLRMGRAGDRDRAPHPAPQVRRAFTRDRRPGAREPRPARRGDADPPLRRRCCGRARRPAAPLAGTRRPGPRRVPIRR